MSQEELKEAESQVENTTSAEQSDAQKKNLLFGTISYKDDSAYESFLQNMNLNQAVFVLIASANFAQARGSFNLLESEVLATAIRSIKKNSKTENSSEPAGE